MVSKILDKLFPSKMLKRFVIADLKPKLRPGFYIHEVNTFCAKKTPEGYWSVYVEVRGDFKYSTFTCGFLIYDETTGKRRFGKLVMEDECAFDETVVDEATRIIKETK